MFTIYDCPGRVDFGVGAVKRIDQAVECFDSKHPLFVTDKGLASIGVPKKATDVLDAKGVDYVYFDEIAGEPNDKLVETVLEQIVKNNVDAVIAFGGGSTMDACKAALIVHANGGIIEDYEGVDVGKKKSLPLIVVPTTAGTGSEVENTFIIASEKKKRKMVLVSRTAIPDYSICDPELTLTLPPRLTLGPGMDALAHAMESYLAKGASEMSRIYAKEAMNLIYNNLAECVHNGSNIEARTNQLLGSMLAGSAMSNSGCGVCHAVTAPLGAYFHITHGDANAMCLAQAMKFNAEAVPEKMVEMGVAMGMGTKEELTADIVVDNIFKLAETCNMPTLKDYGVSLDQIDDTFISEVVNEFSATMNPREIKAEDVIPFLRACGAAETKEELAK